MRKVFQSVYLTMLRLQAVYGLALLLAFGVVLPEAMAAGGSVNVLMAIAAGAGVVTLMLLIPRLTPNWLACPAGVLQLFPVLVVVAIAWVTGLILCVLPGGAGPAPKAKEPAAAPAQWSPPKDDMGLNRMDVRELRHSRMQNLA
jgi:hypothetical protein